MSPAQEAFALIDLVQIDELVRLVRLVDGAGSTDHRRESRPLELPRLGRVGGGVDAVVAGDRAGDALGLSVLLGAERGRLG